MPTKITFFKVQFYGVRRTKTCGSFNFGKCILLPLPHHNSHQQWLTTSKNTSSFLSSSSFSPRSTTAPSRRMTLRALKVNFVGWMTSLRRSRTRRRYISTSCSLLLPCYFTKIIQIVAIQCIGEAFGVDINDAAQAQTYSTKPATLVSIFDVFVNAQKKLKVRRSPHFGSTRQLWQIVQDDVSYIDSCWSLCSFGIN